MDSYNYIIGSILKIFSSLTGESKVIFNNELNAFEVVD
jgi:hypothetical protein